MIDYLKYTSFLLVVLLFLSSCSLLGDDEKEDDWKNEILMAQECGDIGLMCCIEKDPKCKFGSCCVDPNNSERNMCSEDCQPGMLDNYCKIDNECDMGLACSDGICKECGELNQSCCGEKRCDGELACFRGMCVECGLSGNPCCEAEPQCANAGATNPDRNECINELCTPCGSNGSLSCKEEPKCNESHILNNGKCYNCGGYNQPCCTEKINPQESKKVCNEGLECKLDFCSN